MKALVPLQLITGDCAVAERVRVCRASEDAESPQSSLSKEFSAAENHRKYFPAQWLLLPAFLTPSIWLLSTGEWALVDP